MRRCGTTARACTEAPPQQCPSDHDRPRPSRPAHARWSCDATAAQNSRKMTAAVAEMCSSALASPPPRAGVWRTKPSSPAAAAASRAPRGPRSPPQGRLDESGTRSGEDRSCLGGAAAAEAPRQRLCVMPRRPTPNDAGVVGRRRHSTVGGRRARSARRPAPSCPAPPRSGVRDGAAEKGVTPRYGRHCPPSLPSWYPLRRCAAAAAAEPQRQSRSGRAVGEREARRRKSGGKVRVSAV